MSDVVANPTKENENVNTSLSDFNINQTNSESSLFYKCTLCPTPHYSKSNMLENHDEPRQTPTKFFKCEVPGCGYKTCHRGKLNHHAIFHSDKKFKCDECAFTTKSEKYLGNHKDAIHNPNSKRFFCKECSYNSISKYDFRRHEMSHKDPALHETLKCSFVGCPFECKSKKSLSRHAIVHKDLSEIKSLKCPSCSYETIFKRHLQQHSIKHNKDLRDTMYCFNCSYKTVRKDYLIHHMLKHTKVEALEMFKCSQCSYMSNRRCNLLQHMVKHSDVERFKCFLCAFETKRKHTLRNHMDTHKKS